MEENPEELFLRQEEYLEKIKADRLKLRLLIKKIMEEELNQEFKLEDDLMAVMKSLSKEQQNDIYSKIRLAQLFPDQE